MPVNDYAPEAIVCSGWPLHRWRGRSLVQINDTVITGPLDWARSQCIFDALNGFGLPTDLTIGALASQMTGVAITIDITEQDRIRFVCDEQITLSFAEPALWGFDVAVNASVQVGDTWQIVADSDWTRGIVQGWDLRFACFVHNTAESHDVWPGPFGDTIGGEITILESVRAQGTLDRFTVFESTPSLTEVCALPGATVFFGFDPVADRVFLSHSSGDALAFVFLDSYLRDALGFDTDAPEFTPSRPGSLDRVAWADRYPAGVVRTVDGVNYTEETRTVANSILFDTGEQARGIPRSVRVYSATFQCTGYWTDANSEDRLRSFFDFYEGVFTVYQARQERRRIAEPRGRYSLSQTPETANRIGALALGAIDNQIGALAPIAPNILAPITMTGAMLK